MPNTHQIMSLAELLQYVQNHKLNLFFPVYQRDYVWDQGSNSSIKNQLKKQLEALTNDPSGSLFLQTLVVCEKQNEKTLNVVDGQQRLRTLANLLDGWPCKLTNIFGPTSSPRDEKSDIAFDDLKNRIFFVVHWVNASEDSASEDSARKELALFLAINRIHLDWNIEDHWLAKIKEHLSSDPEQLKHFNKQVDTLYSWCQHTKAWFELTPESSPDDISQVNAIFQHNKVVNIFEDALKTRSHEKVLKDRARFIQLLQLVILEASGKSLDDKLEISSHMWVIKALRGLTNELSPLEMLSEKPPINWEHYAYSIAQSIDKLVALLKALISHPSLRQRLVLSKGFVDIKHVSHLLLAWMRKTPSEYSDSDQVATHINSYHESKNEKDKLYARDWLIHYDYTQRGAQGLKAAFKAAFQKDDLKHLFGEEPMVAFKGEALSYSHGLNVYGDGHIEHWWSQELSSNKTTKNGPNNNLNNKALLSSSINESLSNKNPKEKVTKLKDFNQAMIWPSMHVLMELTDHTVNIMEEDFYKLEEALWNEFINALVSWHTNQSFTSEESACLKGE